MGEFVDRFTSPGRGRPFILTEEARADLILTLTNGKAVRLAFNGRDRQSLRNGIAYWARKHDAFSRMNTREEIILVYLELKSREA